MRPNRTTSQVANSQGLIRDRITSALKPRLCIARYSIPASEGAPTVRPGEDFANWESRQCGQWRAKCAPRTDLPTVHQQQRRDPIKLAAGLTIVEGQGRTLSAPRRKNAQLYDASFCGAKKGATTVRPRKDHVNTCGQSRLIRNLLACAIMITTGYRAETFRANTSAPTVRSEGTSAH